MSDLGQRLLIIFESGTAKELAAALQLLHLISLHRKTREAGPDFPDSDRLAELKHANKKSLVSSAP